MPKFSDKSASIARKLNFIPPFHRAQLSSLIATGADYGVLFFLTEIYHVWYVCSVFLGALIGAIVHFFLNRNWSFQAKSGKLKTQAMRYFWVSAVSLLLNTSLVYIMTEFLHLHYFISVFIISIVVSLSFNYPLHRFYVYRVSYE